MRAIQSLKDELEAHSLRCREVGERLVTTAGDGREQPNLPEGSPPFHAPRTSLEAFAEAQAAEKERNKEGWKDGRPQGAGKPGSEIFTAADRFTQPFLAYCEEFFRDVRKEDVHQAPPKDNALSDTLLSIPQPGRLYSVSPESRSTQRAASTSTKQERKKPQLETPSHVAVVSPPNIPEGDKMEDLCHVCWEGSWHDSNPILLCEGCNVAVHQRCYGVKHIPDGGWYCLGCSRQEETGEWTPCALCPSQDGPLATTTNPHQFAHIFCAQWIPETYVKDAEAMSPIENVDKVNPERFNMKCAVCKTKKGACIQCASGNCTVPFHPICAREQPSFRLELVARQDGSMDFKGYCEKHASQRASRLGPASLRSGDASKSSLSRAATSAKRHSTEGAETEGTGKQAPTWAASDGQPSTTENGDRTESHSKAELGKLSQYRTSFPKPPAHSLEGFQRSMSASQVKDVSAVDLRALMLCAKTLGLESDSNALSSYTGNRQEEVLRWLAGEVDDPGEEVCALAKQWLATLCSSWGSSAALGGMNPVVREFVSQDSSNRQRLHSGFGEDVLQRSAQGSAKGQGSTPAAPKKAFQGKLAKGKKSEQEGCEQGEQRQSDEEETVEHFLNRIQERKRAIAGSPMDEIGSELALHQMLLLDQAAENRRTWAQVLERVEHEAVKERERREERLKDVAEVSNFLERVREVKRARQTPKSSVHKGLDEQAGLEDKLVRDAATNEDAACVVCGYAESGPPNDIIFCERCELAVHQNCYGIKEVPDGDWLCAACSAHEQSEREQHGNDLPSRPERSLRTPGDGERLDPRKPCKLCPVVRGAMKRDADSRDGGWVHVACALSHGETCASASSGSSYVCNSSKISADRWGAKCQVCGDRRGACVKCSEEGCNISMHPLCTRNAGLGFYVQRTSSGLPIGADVRCHDHLKREDSMEREVKPAGRDGSASSRGGQQQQATGKRKRRQTEPKELQLAKRVRHDFERLRLLCERMLFREKLRRGIAENVSGIAQTALAVEGSKEAQETLQSLVKSKLPEMPLSGIFARDAVHRVKGLRGQGEAAERGELLLTPGLAESLRGSLPDGMSLSRSQ